MVAAAILAVVLVDALLLVAVLVDALVAAAAVDLVDVFSSSTSSSCSIRCISSRSSISR